MGRIRTITTLQSFAIFLVVLGHSLPLENESKALPTVSLWIYRFVYSFHVPLFIFMSGFLFMYTNGYRKIIYRRYLVKKVRRLLVPYLIISGIAFVL